MKGETAAKASHAVVWTKNLSALPPISHTMLVDGKTSDGQKRGAPKHKTGRSPKFQG